MGNDGTRSAWLMAQHADHDVGWQKECLALMQAERDSGQVSRTDLAYLTDRVRVNEGSKQLYGTQLHSVNGVRQPRPIEQPKRVDKRRKSMGMTTLAEYTKFVNT